MTPLNRDTIVRKVEALQECIRVLRKIGEEPCERFLNDAILQSAAMFQLVVGIEIITDTGNHVLSECFEQSATSYRQVIIELGARGIIPKSFAEENAPMADLRNKLVHHYETIDLEKIYFFACKAPEVFSAFARYFMGFVGA